MDVNVKGVFLCCQVVGARMAEEGRGTIVQRVVDLRSGLAGSTHLYQLPEQRRRASLIKPIAYPASKSALLNMTRYLATYWANARSAREHGHVRGCVQPAGWSSSSSGYLPRVPLGRMARAVEFNPPAPLVFLMSDAAAYMTGSNMVIDGGWTAW